MKIHNIYAHKVKEKAQERPQVVVPANPKKAPHKGLADVPKSPVFDRLSAWKNAKRLAKRPCLAHLGAKSPLPLWRSRPPPLPAVASVAVGVPLMAILFLPLGWSWMTDVESV